MTKQNAKFAQGRWRIHENGDLVGYFEDFEIFPAIERHFRRFCKHPISGTTFEHVNGKSEERYTITLQEQHDKRGFFKKLEGITNDEVHYPDVLNDLFSGKRNEGDRQQFVAKNEEFITTHKPLDHFSNQLSAIKAQKNAQNVTIKKSITNIEALLDEDHKPTLEIIEECCIKQGTEKSLRHAAGLLTKLPFEKDDPLQLREKLAHQIKTKLVFVENKHSVYKALTSSGNTISSETLQQLIDKTLTPEVEFSVSSTNIDSPTEQRPPLNSPKNPNLTQAEIYQQELWNDRIAARKNPDESEKSR